jgi:hypothetical protein
MTVIPPRGAVPEFDAPALLEALKSASASAPLMTLLLGGRNVKALPAKHTYFNFYEDGIKKKKNILRQYIGLYVNPLKPSAGLPNLIRLSL